jgi:capsular polysaccharide biosynthesis protein
LIMPILGLLYSVVVIFISPKKYESTVVVELMSKNTREEGGLATEIAIMLSGETMKEVAECLDLYSNWEMDGDQAIMVLLSAVEFELLEDANLVEVTVRHPISDDAREIASEIPLSYLRRLKRDRKAGIQNGLRKLDELILEEKDILAVKKRKLGEIARSWGMDYEPGQSVQTFLQLLPKEVRLQKSEELAEFEKISREYEEVNQSVAAISEEQIKAKLELAKPFEPVKVHTEARRAQSYNDPNVLSELWWGTGKGLVFGIALALLVYAILKRIAESEGDPDLQKRREADPADVW